MSAVMVKASLSWTYGWAGSFYGPGEDIMIPEGLANAVNASREPDPKPSVPQDEFPALTKAGLTLEQAKEMSDEELLALEGVGAATVAKIRQG